MAASERDSELVISYLRSMQMGSAGIEGMIGLYTDDGVCIEHLTRV